MGAHERSIAKIRLTGNLMMNSIISESQQTEVGKGTGLRDKIIPLLILLFVLAVSVGIFLYGRSLEVVAQLESYGYLGAFLISLIGNAGVILSAPILPILSAIGAVIYPVTGLPGPIIVGLVGGVGAGIGETVGYAVGYSGRGAVGNNRLYLRMVEWMKRWGAIAVFVLSIVPFFFDLAGIAAGVLRFPLRKFVLACWLGRTILYVGMITAVALGWEVWLRYFG